MRAMQAGDWMQAPTDVLEDGDTGRQWVRKGAVCHVLAVYADGSADVFFEREGCTLRCFPDELIFLGAANTGRAA